MNVRPPRHADAEALRRFSAPSTGNPVLDREVAEARVDAFTLAVGALPAGATVTFAAGSTVTVSSGVLSSTGLIRVAA